MKARSKTPTEGGFIGFIEARIGSILVYFVLLPLLACMVLILPPLELPNRIFAAGFTAVAKTGVEIKDADGTTLTIPEGAVTTGSSVKLSSQPAQSAAANLAQTLPAYLDVKSPLYTFAIQGDRPKEATLSIPIPDGSEPYNTLDLYAMYGRQWFKIPFILNDQDMRLESDLNFTPDAVLIAQTRPQAPLIDAMLTANNALPDEDSKVVIEVNPAGLRLADQGAVAGDVMSLPETSAYSTYAIIPTVSNVDESGPRLDLAENMLNEPSQRTAHINLLVDIAVQKLYSGYNLDYQGLGPEDQEVYTAFVKDLASALHAKQKVLSVTLPLPKPISQDQWDTGGYNWPLIGRYADEVKIPIMPDLHAYEGETPLVDQYLQWAVGQVDRYKLQLAVSLLGRDESGTQYSTVSYLSILKLLGPVSIPDQVRPGDQVTFELPKLRAAGGIQHHDPSGLFYFNYKDDQGAQHTVWVENADSVANNISRLLKFNIHGIALQDLDTRLGTDPRVWPVLEQYRSLQASTMQTNLTVVWLIDGVPVGTSAASDPKFTWKAAGYLGQHSVDVSLSVDDGKSFAPGGNAQALLISTPPTPIPPTPRPTRVPTEAPPTEAPSQGPAPKPTAKPPPAVPTGGGFSGKNLFGYGAQLNWTNSDHDGELGTLNGMGFGWAKIQVRWCDVQGSPGQTDPGALDDMTAKAAAHGIKLLFSVVCAPNWTRADGGAGGSGPPDDPNTLASFLSAVSARYCNKGLGAIEVWNEENLLTEWHGKPISASAYVNMLRASYGAIHAACPSVVVVSGAPTPTGVNNSTAVDDQAYLQQMYAAGLAGVSDAIGAHPSGFNNPPSADWRTWQDPARPNFKGHPSFFFSGTMQGYRNIMVANGDGGKQIWPTEFGWGSTGAPFPGYEYEAQISETDQANWLVQSYQMMKAWGWVGAAFTWNLDFTNMGNETGAFHIVGRPAQGALAAMPK